MNALGKTLVVFGLVLVAAGLLLMFAGKFNIPFGRLPGDIVIHKKNFTFFAPFGSMLVISIVLTVIMHIFSKFK